MLPYIAASLSLVILVWSADRFIDGSSTLARQLGIPPLLIGMVIVGFGTSLPELAVSALAARAGNAGIALGNVYGSNIANIGLILGLSALVRPIGVHSRVLRKELPILTVVTALAVVLIWDHEVSRLDAIILLATFGVLMAWTLVEGLGNRSDPLAMEVQRELGTRNAAVGRAVIWTSVGLVFLVGSSRLLVWSAVEIASHLGVTNLVIGLTVVAVGTSLPELASSITAARRGEDDIALGNILGSNLFNTLAVAGIAAAIRPLAAEPAMLVRDLPVMTALTVGLFVVGFGFRRQGRITRAEGGLLLTCYVAYTTWLALSPGL